MKELNEHESAPFSSAYNVILFNGSMALVISGAQWLIWEDLLLFSGMIACFLISVFTRQFRFMWKNTAWFKSYLLTLTCSQLVFLVAAWLLQEQLISVAGIVTAVVIFLAHGEDLNKLIKKYEIPEKENYWN